jgi:DEAD/DEAH box helicase domain-containing protein
MQLFLYQIAVAGTSRHATHWDLMVWVPPSATGEPLLPSQSSEPDDAGWARANAVGPAAIIAAGADAGRLTYMTTLPGRAGQHTDWPGWVPAGLISALAGTGVTAPWLHQAEAANLARSGQSVIISTGTASGKSLGYLLPALASILDGGTALYLAPTRALAADQLKLIRSLGLDRVRAAVVDGDTPWTERTRARSHANYVLTTPDMLHQSLLPGHSRWNGFLRRLRFVIVDECHTYSGVFGSHVAHVLRRLRRLAYHHSATEPVFVLASATISEPARCGELLTGRSVIAVRADGAPASPLTFALWEPPLTGARGEAGAPVRRAATTEAARLLADLVGSDVPALVFVRSRRGAESVAQSARRHLTETGLAGLAERVAAYRSGYLPEERRALEEALRTGEITGLAATSALELGVNVTGLDAVLMAGWPGTRAALWQQAGRAGRAGRDAVAVLIARDDPLDTYLVHHPEALVGTPVETTVLDPGNSYVLAPHLCAAAAELPLTAHDLAGFSPGAGQLADGLAADGLLRRRGGRWFCTRQGLTTRAGLRGTDGWPVRIVERTTGRLVGTVDEPSAHFLAHSGAVYQHQGDTYLVSNLDLTDRIALVDLADPGYVTVAREITSVELVSELARAEWGPARICFGDVLVTRQVISYARRSVDTGLLLAEAVLDLPERRLPTRAVWWTISAEQRAELAAARLDLAGAAHAAEHAAIGLLPLVAACDRWDVGGVSADLHPATGKLTVFVYDGHAGGAGFAERGFAAAAPWLAATADAIATCECAAGCPSCIQSPKCGNGNHPLAKDDAVTLLRCLLAGAAEHVKGPGDNCAASQVASQEHTADATMKMSPQSGSRLTGPDMGRPPSGGRTGVAIRSGSGGAEPGPLLEKA